MPDTDSLLSLQGVSLFQNERLVLEDIQFSMDKGEFVYLVGRTGSGKSSLLKFLYADLSTAQGKGQVLGFPNPGIERSQIPALRRKMGIIFQDFQLFYDRTVAENLSFVMRATGWKDSTKIKARQAEVLMRVGLGNANNKYPHQLSGGEQQRIVIARALLNEPQILIADEPTGNLDPEISREIIRLFHEINRSGTAVLMATHNHYLIKEFPARVLMAEKGRLREANLNDLGKDWW